MEKLLGFLVVIGVVVGATLAAKYLPAAPAKAVPTQSIALPGEGYVASAAYQEFVAEMAEPANTAGEASHAEMSVSTLPSLFQAQEGRGGQNIEVLGRTDAADNFRVRMVESGDEKVFHFSQIYWLDSGIWGDARGEELFPAKGPYVPTPTP